MKRIAVFLCCLCFLPLVPVLTSCSDESAGTSYVMTAEYLPDQAKLSVDMTVSYKNTTETELTELLFNLPANAYREGAKYAPISPSYHASAYDGKINYGGMHISSVTGGSAWAVGGEDENVLSVTLSESLFPDETVTVRITFDTLLAQVNHRLGITKDSVNLGNFYPVLCVYDGGFYPCVYYSDGDPFYSECADYDVTLVMPSAYRAATSGEVISSSTSGGKLTLHTRIKNARDYAAVLSPSFSVLSEQVGDTTLQYYYTEDADAQQNFKLFKACFSYFSETFGAYPYATLSTVQTAFCYGGMEYPALTMINRTLQAESYRYTIVHETAHQWWYAVVGNNQVEHAWMDEGLAEYSSLLFFEQAPDYGITRESLVLSAQKAFRAFVSVYKQIFGESDTSMERHLKSFLSEYEYANIVYHKGLLLFENLRESIGEERFFTGLKQYYKKYAFQIAEPDDLIGCFERTGVDIEGYFRSFLEGNAII